ncbi:MAG: 4-(cytidine 5'-diphospho)-2-C-methyl-D-erythritol kinase [Candidatus Omnitrophica bacterium CG11_big_fil_rev_8_21_14_0_20_43_6]|nr:MAG: 4-(cytidine 5'-diphospho)-2-C-methyl-D-erythritol kinase [Candidatus Omnitrophica bacterium CG11_big_fil_rev_8_21_14_0_20_43_6]
MGYFSTPLVIKSFAKLNLYLQVLSKRKDKFHNLSTLFVRIDLADTVTFSKRKDNLIKISCDSRQVPKNKTNLGYRAAALLKQELKVDSGIEIGIKKRIPVGAGLGGGSANAASVLLGLNKLWNLNLSKTKLAKLGAKLGSDVPFFIHQTKFALGSQRGDKIKPLTALDKLKLWFILVYPNFKASTPLIYQKYDAYLSAIQHLEEIQDGKKLKIKQGAGLTRPGCNVKILTSELLEKGRAFDAACLFNGLEAVTGSLYPVVNQVKKALCGMGLDKVIMSGSGPSVYAICNSYSQAKRLKDKLHKQRKSWQVFAVSSV